MHSPQERSFGAMPQPEMEMKSATFRNKIRAAASWQKSQELLFLKLAFCCTCEWYHPSQKKERKTHDEWKGAASQMHASNYMLQLQTTKVKAEAAAAAAHLNLALNQDMLYQQRRQCCCCWFCCCCCHFKVVGAHKNMLLATLKLKKEKNFHSKFQKYF